MYLVLNAGSSSLKFKVFNKSLEVLAKGSVEEIYASDHSLYHFEASDKGLDKNTIKPVNHKEALELVLKFLKQNDLSRIDAVGHRVVHGGPDLAKPTVLTAAIIIDIEKVSHMAPLHNPANLQGIKASREVFTNVPQIAVFDTGFHSTIPARAFSYAIDHQLTEEGYRRYGFHGISHEYIRNQTAYVLARRKDSVSLISCHLGNGCSICAIHNGQSVDTSMGYTPLEGLVMGTRSGDIDAGLIFSLMRDKEMSPEEVETLLNKKSGLLGISGLDNDLRTLLENRKDPKVELALNVFSYRLARYISSYLMLVPDKTPVVFTGGIGENSPVIRSMVINHLEKFGYQINDRKNEGAAGAEASIESNASAPVLVIPTNEEKMIAEKMKDLIY